MLGVRRASVTEVARRLQKAGLIDYIHGKVTVLDGSGTVLSASAYGWRYGFQGMRFDPATGYNTTLNREYSPTLARWTQSC